jgi:ribosomal protein S18 acetylase RimI-like enzyme
MIDPGIIRLATPEDAKAIAQLTREAYAKWVAVIGREPLPMQVDYAEALRRHRIDLMESEGGLVGLIETVPAGDLLLIVNVAVRPDCQKRGFGVRLVAHAEALARESGLAGLRLYTNARFAENIRFYERLGFAREREAPLAGGVAVYMVKPS